MLRFKPKNTATDLGDEINRSLIYNARILLVKFKGSLMSTHNKAKKQKNARNKQPVEKVQVVIGYSNEPMHTGATAEIQHPLDTHPRSFEPSTTQHIATAIMAQNLPEDAIFSFDTNIPLEVAVQFITVMPSSITLFLHPHLPHETTTAVIEAVREKICDNLDNALREAINVVMKNAVKLVLPTGSRAIRDMAEPITIESFQIPMTQETQPAPSKTGFFTQSGDISEDASILPDLRR